MKINTALILCAGLGKRLNPLTLTTPKPLLKINNVTMLENCINMIIKLGIKKILLNTFHLSDQIFEFIKKKNFMADIQIINDGKFILDTGGGVLNMINNNQNLFIGELIDKNGSHGEIVLLIIDHFGLINTFVMSCRVFQRKVEYGIIKFLKELNFNEVTFKYFPTKRNSPFLNFAEIIGNKKSNNLFTINLSKNNKNLSDLNDIIKIKKI